MRYRILPAALGAAILAGWAGLAQMHKVSKPEQVVRAVGVYEWTGDLAKPKGSRFIPVSVFIEGEFQDAGVYVARPVPFALETGNIYELQDAGVPKGTVELAYARHVQATDSSGDPLFNDGWIGYGPYHAPRLTAAALRPSKTLPAITTSGGDSSKPHLSDKSDSGAKAGADDADRPTMKRRDSSGDSSAGSGGTTSPASAGTPADDPDRPTMKRRTDDTTTASSGGSSGGGSSDDDADRPTLKRRSPEETKKVKDKDWDPATVLSTGKSLNDDPDRPTLHHQQTSKERELSELSGIPADMHQMVAVSDAKTRDTHPFVRAWEDDTERAMVLEKMRAFARAQLAAYKTPPGGTVMVASGTGASSAQAAHAAPTESVAAATAKAEQDPGAPTLKRGVPQHKDESAAAAPATTSTKTTTARTSAAPANVRMKRPIKTTALAPVPLLDEDLRGYTLSYGGAPTFVYTAHTDGTGSALRYVTIVAQDNGVRADGSGVSTSGQGGLGELKLALVNVTDEAHLDRTPRMRLVDVVDAEASNRASLLFELRANRSRQFALYRVIAAKPEQIFSTGTTE